MGRKIYKCWICKKEGVKLWRPYMDTEPLICAKCAEERQTEREYEEKSWSKQGEIFVGTPTGKMHQLPKWEVNGKGKIPTGEGLVPDGTESENTTNMLEIKFLPNDRVYYTYRVSMVPALPDGKGDYISYLAMPPEEYKKWEELPNE